MGPLAGVGPFNALGRVGYPLACRFPLLLPTGRYLGGGREGGGFRMAVSIFAIISAAGTSNTSASFSRITILGPWMPRSTMLINDLSSSAAAASCSWDIPFPCRHSRKTLPKAHFGPFVG